MTGNPLQFSEDAELVSKDKEALALLSGVEEIKEERNQGLLAPEAVSAQMWRNSVIPFTLRNEIGKCRSKYAAGKHKLVA